MNRVRNRPNLEGLDIRRIQNTTVIFDIDGAITDDGQVVLDDSVYAKICELGSGNAVYLFSNYRNNTRNKIVASRVGYASSGKTGLIPVRSQWRSRHDSCVLISPIGEASVGAFRQEPKHN